MAGKISDKKEVTIDEKYLRRLTDTPSWQRELDTELSDLVRGGDIHLRRPEDMRLTSLYGDVLSYVSAKAIEGGYVPHPDNQYDANKIAAILGGNIRGSIERGYRFHRK